MHIFCFEVIPARRPDQIRTIRVVELKGVTSQVVSNEWAIRELYTGEFQVTHGHKELPISSWNVISQVHHRPELMDQQRSGSKELRWQTISPSSVVKLCPSMSLCESLATSGNLGKVVFHV
ncbi:hypothetical protein D3C78_1101460 [compost metagenome]